jgi:hypothetical protein
MEILDSFDGSLLANEDKFQDDFFKRFPLVKRKIQLTDTLEKEYDFPTLYGDVTCAQAIFLCSYDAALALMPHPKVKPVKSLKNRAVLAISCYEYKNVLGIPPYNEIAFTFAVEVDRPKDRVLTPLIFDDYSGYYVFSMPVTSRENCLRGNNIWGLPKVTQEIDIDVSGDEALVTAYEKGVAYFSLRMPKTGKSTEMDVVSYLYSKLDGKMLKAQTCFKGDFQINKNMGVLLNPSKQPEKPYLTLGDTPAGEVLKSLQIGPTPLQLRYVEHMTACFDFYDESYELL